MEKLSTNWLTEGFIDFEYKKYVLLAYIQYVSKNFDEKKLYPCLADLIQHHSQLQHFKATKQATDQQFPQKLKKIDIQKFALEYEKMITDDSYLDEVIQIVDFALPIIEQHLNNGKELYNAIENQINIQPIGIIPLYIQSGYLLLQNGMRTSDTQVYTYQLSIFETYNEKFRAIQTKFVDTYPKQFNNTYEHIKTDLMQKNKHLPNPATFAIASEQPLCLHETFLPIAKRSFVRFIGAQ